MRNPHSSPLRFYSLFLTFERPAASTALQRLHTKSLLNCTALHVSSRSYAKKRTMPPKKAVEEKKILLGRPGNSLKSGIVRSTPQHLSHSPQLMRSRLVLPMLESRLSSRPSPSASWEILQYVACPS